MAINSKGKDKVLDWKICLYKTSNDKDLAVESLKLLLPVLEEHKKVFAEACATKDIMKLRFEVHKMDGGLCFYGLPCLHKAVLDFGKALREEERIDMDLYDHMFAEIAKAKKAIEKQLKKIDN